MCKEDVKVGMWVFFKQDYEVSGKVVSKPDRNGYVNVQGPDEETSDGMYNVHYSQLEEE